MTPDEAADLLFTVAMAKSKVTYDLTSARKRAKNPLKPWAKTEVLEQEAKMEIINSAWVPLELLAEEYPEIIEIAEERLVDLTSVASRATVSS